MKAKEQVHRVQFYDSNGRSFTLDRVGRSAVLRRDDGGLDCVFAINDPTVARMVGQALIAMCGE